LWEIVARPRRKGGEARHACPAQASSSPIPFGIKRDLLAYFADLNQVKYIRSNPKQLARVEAELPILRNISTKAQYPDTAFLPEPAADRPDGAPGPSQPAPKPPSQP